MCDCYKLSVAIAHKFVYIEHMDTSHLIALHAGLSHERTRLISAAKPSEIALRTVWVKQYESQIEDEYVRLGMTPTSELSAISDDDLLAELMS